MIDATLVKLLEKINPYITITEEMHLIDEGVLDSLSLLIFVSELERAFSFKMPDEELKLENFKDLSSIAALVTRYTDTPV